MSPAKAEQIILQRFGEDAQLVAIGLYPQCPMALGQLCPVGSMDQRDVRIDRLRPAHGADELKLAEGVVQMIVATDHMADAPNVILDHQIGSESCRERVWQYV